ncbi:hypothetical protein TSOC_011692 [Tetrabaena socialis]|uniref:Uncharacterized protein n=1 Tax=Tetrabaena socialis TaxID=47790 RepID=A0A2J7ZPZ0_9CHLO|nr:hypothetical protein TSOC_011692 [Tetrabaena socialis]|eukprot:PNH02337.1 hypothetical protein TSOC_011692 [Tetrabaena socialis]
MHAVEGLCRFKSRKALASPAVADFVQKLLRMHTLQCLSKQFAAAATAAGVLAPPQLKYLASAAMLFCNLEAMSRGGVMVEEEDGDKAGLLLELARALRDSSVLEHASRLLLLCEEAAAVPSWIMPSAVLRVYYNATTMYRKNEEGLTGASAAEAEAVRAALREVLRGPCARHAALVHGVAMLCRADGGPSYGLPARLLIAALPQTRTDSAVPGARVMLDRTARALLSVCEEGMPPTRLGRRIAVLLLLRLARMAVASARVWAQTREHQLHPAGAAQPGVGAADLLGLSQLLLLPMHDTAELVMGSVSVAWRLLAEALALQPDGWAAAAGAELWRLMDAETRRGLQWGINNEELRWLGSELSWRLGAVLADAYGGDAEPASSQEEEEEEEVAGGAAGQAQAPRPGTAASGGAGAGPSDRGGLPGGRPPASKRPSVVMKRPLLAVAGAAAPSAQQAAEAEAPRGAGAAEEPAGASSSAAAAVLAGADGLLPRRPQLKRPRGACVGALQQPFKAPVRTAPAPPAAAAAAALGGRAGAGEAQGEKRQGEGEGEEEEEEGKEQVPPANGPARPAPPPSSAGGVRHAAGEAGRAYGRLQCGAGGGAGDGGEGRGGGERDAAKEVAVPPVAAPLLVIKRRQAFKPPGRIQQG